MESKVYRSKFGWAVFLIITAILILVSWLGWNPERSVLGNISTHIFSIVILVLFTVLSKTTRYTITAKELHIKCPPFYNKTIALDRINKVEVSRNIISSPAPSLDRIELYYDKFDSVVISPRDKFQFMEDLKQRNPSITVIKSH